jgi:NTE family protein
MILRMNFIPPKRICFSGGGIRAISYVGALEVLHSHGMLNHVREYIGISAGAFMAFALCLGYTLEDLKKVCFEFDFGLIRNLEAENFLDFFEQFGIDNGQRLQRFLESLLKQKNLPLETTFQEFHEKLPLQPELRCFATDLNICEAKEFSRSATPHIKLVDALRATMSLTFYFTPIRDPETGHLLTDGGVLHNYPMNFLTPEERSVSLGLTFSMDHATNKSITDIYDFLHQMFACVYLPRNKKVLEEVNENTIILPNGDYPAWNFEASKEDRENLSKMAAEATRRFLREGVPRKIGRRFSAS